MKEKFEKFEEFNISENVKKALADIGYVNPTEIQKKAIPEVLSGKDVIGQSQTGTGKTASFGIPIIEKINQKDRAVQAVILCPTRELALQIVDELRKYTKYTESIKLLAVYGGQDIMRQIRELKRGVQIVIGTPGRIMDHMRRKTLKLGNVKTIVLDEADEMLNMGFEEDIITILKDIPEERQTVLFSATMNPRIRNIAKKYLTEPKNIKIKEKELVVDNIDQISVDIKQGMKNEAITRMIDIYKPQKAMIFCNTKRKVDDVIEYLKQKRYKAEGIHGDVKQIQRERIIKGLRSGQFQILVATDVAARGIDINDLELVINYDIPQEEEYYVHRIGRTGRNGQKGKAITFVVGREKNKLNSIQKYTNSRMEKGKIPTVNEIKEMKRKELIGKINKVIDKQEYANVDILEELLKQHEDVVEVAKALMTMYSKKTSLAAVETNKVKNDEYKKMSNEKGYVKLFLNLGKIDKIMAKDIVGSLSGNTAISGEEIGKIKVLDKFSFVEIPHNYVDEILECMSDKQIKGKDVSIEIAKA